MTKLQWFFWVPSTFFILQSINLQICMSQNIKISILSLQVKNHCKNPHGSHFLWDLSSTNHSNITAIVELFKYLISSELFVCTSLEHPTSLNIHFNDQLATLSFQYNIILYSFLSLSIQMKRNCQRKCLFRKSMKAVRDCSIFQSLSRLAIRRDGCRFVRRDLESSACAPPRAASTLSYHKSLETLHVASLNLWRESTFLLRSLRRRGKFLRRRRVINFGWIY